MPGIEIIRQSGVGIKFLIHVDRFKVFERSFCKEVLCQDVPCASLHPWCAGAAANRSIKTSSISRSPHRGRIRAVMALPVFSVGHETRQELRVVTKIYAIAIKVAFTTTINERAGVV